MNAISQSKAKWDAKNGIYTNYTYGFSWYMGKEYKWEQEKRAAGDGSFVASAMESIGGKDLQNMKAKLLSGLKVK